MSLQILNTVNDNAAFDAIQKPQFETGNFVDASWRAYVPNNLKHHWFELSVEARFIIYEMAKQQSEKAIWR